MNKIKYDTDKYNFSDIVKDWLEVEDLTKLHKFKKYKLFKRVNDQSSMWHKMFYNQIGIDKRFNDLYTNFLEEEIKPKFGEKIIYQKIPTFRVHLPGNIAVGEFHKDKHYRDKNWAKKVKETNYYFPLTDAYGTNTVWAETEEDLGDFKPFDCKHGEYISWDASNLTHGNKINVTSITRVSFDFRVIPESNYIESSHKTINVGIPFSLGGYYEKL
tara:strand:- start:207 stop:851 length:645 start_codon:yes stop_codon:yes gene_type:complete